MVAEIIANKLVVGRPLNEGWAASAERVESVENTIATQLLLTDYNTTNDITLRYDMTGYDTEGFQRPTVQLFIDGSSLLAHQQQQQ